MKVAFLLTTELSGNGSGGSEFADCSEVTEGFTNFSPTDVGRYSTENTIGRADESIGCAKN
jgi:hypothetical protein